MLLPVYSKQFSKDIKRIQKRRKSQNKLKVVIQKLVNGERLNPIYKDHKLIGNYKGRRECHLEPNWLLIYKIKEDEIIFERTGTHSDLFE